MTDYKEILRRLALSDERFVESVLGMGRDTVDDSRLDPKTHYLVRLGAAFAIDAAPSSYQSSVGCARRRRQCGRDRRDPGRGGIHRRRRTRRFRRPELALALGYDVDAALESPGETAG